MILVDTNLVSELMRADPAPAVLDWFSRHDASTLHLSAICEAELRRGVALLPWGKRRDQLARAVEAVLVDDFAGRILPFDSAAAAAFAAVFVERRAAGRPISFQDCQIAATARAHGAVVATRNVSDFEDCGIEVVDPWNPQEAEPAH